MVKFNAPSLISVIDNAIKKGEIATQAGIDCQNLPESGSFILAPLIYKYFSSPSVVNISPPGDAPIDIITMAAVKVVTIGPQGEHFALGHHMDGYIVPQIEGKSHQECIHEFMRKLPTWAEELSFTIGRDVTIHGVEMAAIPAQSIITATTRDDFIAAWESSETNMVKALKISAQKWEDDEEFFGKFSQIPSAINVALYIGAHSL